MTPWSRLWWAGPLALTIFVLVLPLTLLFGLGVLVLDL